MQLSRCTVKGFPAHKPKLDPIDVLMQHPTKGMAQWEAIVGSTSVFLMAFDRASVPPSSAPIRRLYPATSYFVLNRADAFAFFCCYGSRVPLCRLHRFGDPISAGSVFVARTYHKEPLCPTRSTMRTTKWTPF